MGQVSNETCTKCQHCGQFTNYADDAHHKARMEELDALRAAALITEEGMAENVSVVQHRVIKVLQRIAKQVLADNDDADVYAGYIGEMLQGLHENDFFGTEGQCDPRGDFREGEWDMDRVQGVDE